jgi:hypothetical protein
MSPERKAAVERNSVPLTANFSVKQDYNYPNDSNKKFDPLGFLSSTSLGERLHAGNFNWLGIIGVIGIIIAFGHSILGMSGYETLAQVYREVEAPKLPNFRKAAFIVFIYSLSLTSAISFLAVLLIPDDVRMPQYSQNLIGGLSMHVIGPVWAKLILNAFVVVVGALILSGARLDAQTPPKIRHQLPHPVPDPGIAIDNHHRQSGRRSPAWRGIRLRRGLELCFHDRVDGDSALQGQDAARLSNAAQSPPRVG